MTQGEIQTCEWTRWFRGLRRWPTAGARHQGICFQLAEMEVQRCKIYAAKLWLERSNSSWRDGVQRSRGAMSGLHGGGREVVHSTTTARPLKAQEAPESDRAPTELWWMLDRKCPVATRSSANELHVGTGRRSYLPVSGKRQTRFAPTSRHQKHQAGYLA
ncbi:hypothetical protein BC567DRAFT_205618 [Phyllosticta citribraziliensis]